MIVAIYIRDATSADDANAKAKLTQAYQKILRSYPPTTWNRRHVSTKPHLGEPRPGAAPAGWMVNFVVEPRP